MSDCRLNEARDRAHHEIDVLVLEFLNNVQVGLLGGVHAGVSKTLGDAGDGDAGEQEQRCVGVAQPVHGDDGNAGALAVAFQHAVRGGVVDLPFHKDWLILGKSLGEFGKLDDLLPVKLHLTY